MKSLYNKAIIFDDQCPACKVYTSGFVRWGLLEKENRIPFTRFTQHEQATHLDWQRARHEIPLIDLQGGKTIYGLDALIFILSHKIPLIKKITSFRPVYAFFSGLYNIISYNRRIIIPTYTPAQYFDCRPDFSLTYRLYFMMLAISIAGMITYAFGTSLSNFTGLKLTGADMLCIAGTGWVIQIALALCCTLPFQPQQRIDYITHLGVIMVIGVLILLPGMALSSLTQYQYAIIPAISVLVSSLTMLWQHISRVHHLQLSQCWTISWFIILQTTAILWLWMVS